MGSDHIRVIPTSCSELIGICSEKFRAISKIGSDFTDAAFRADMRVSEQNRSEPLGNASFRSETVGESKDLGWAGDGSCQLWFMENLGGNTDTYFKDIFIHQIRTSIDPDSWNSSGKCCPVSLMH